MAAIITIPKYLDLGEIISGTAGGAGYQLAANAIAVSNLFTDVQWVRTVLLTTKASTGGSAILYTYRGDTQGVTSDSGSISLSLSINYYTTVLHPSANSSVYSSILGYSGKYGIKNSTGSTINVWARAQLLG